MKHMNSHDLAAATLAEFDTRFGLPIAPMTMPKQVLEQKPGHWSRVLLAIVLPRRTSSDT